MGLSTPKSRCEPVFLSLSESGELGNPSEWNPNSRLWAALTIVWALLAILLEPRLRYETKPT